MCAKFKTLSFGYFYQFTFATRSYGNDLKFVSNWLQCLVTSQPAHPRVKCYIIPVFLMWPSHGKLKLTNSCCRLPCEGCLNKLPQLSLFLGPTQFTFLFSINKLCMKVDLVSFKCCGCGGLGIFRFNGVSHEGQFCY